MKEKKDREYYLKNNIINPYIKRLQTTNMQKLSKK